MKEIYTVVWYHGSVEHIDQINTLKYEQATSIDAVSEPLSVLPADIRTKAFYVRGIYVQPGEIMVYDYGSWNSFVAILKGEYDGKELVNKVLIEY